MMSREPHPETFKDVMTLTEIEEALSNRTSMTSVGLFHKNAPDYIRFLLDEVKRLKDPDAIIACDKCYSVAHRVCAKCASFDKQGARRDGVREGLKMAADIIQCMDSFNMDDHYGIVCLLKDKAGEI